MATSHEMVYSVEIVCQGRRVSTVDCAQMVPGMIAKGDREARCTWHLHGQVAALLLINEEAARAAVGRGLHGRLLPLNTPLGCPGWAVLEQMRHKHTDVGFAGTFARARMAWCFGCRKADFMMLVLGAHATLAVGAAGVKRPIFGRELVRTLG